MDVDDSSKLKPESERTGPCGLSIVHDHRGSMKDGCTKFQRSLKSNKAHGDALSPGRDRGEKTDEQWTRQQDKVPKTEKTVL